MKAVCPYPFINDCTFKENGWCSDFMNNPKNPNAKCKNVTEEKKLYICPFIQHVFEFEFNCIYLIKEIRCTDLYVCPGNSDAFCSEMINIAHDLIKNTDDLIISVKNAKELFFTEKESVFNIK